MTFSICRGFSEELTLVFNERYSTVTLFQMLNNPDFVQNCVFPAKLALVIGDPDQLSAGLPVELVVFRETEFMLAFNVIFKFTEEQRLVTISAEGLNGVLHIVAVVFMHLVVSLHDGFLGF